MNDALVVELLKLTAAERIRLAEELWDSVASDTADLPSLTDPQRREIERRLEEHDRDPNSALPWDEIRARLWSRIS